MRNSKIVANGTEMGIYQAENFIKAIAAYVSDAGYESIEDAADACGQTVDEFVSDLQVSEEESESGSYNK